MENTSLARGKNFAARMLVAQTGVTLLAAAVFAVWQGWSSAGAALVGGLIPTFALALSALRTLSGGIKDAGQVLTGLMVGLVMKWTLIALGLYLALATFQLPAPAVLGGFVAAFSAQFFVGIFKA